MTTFVTTDELDILKAQMQVLRNHLHDSEIISKEMLEATVKTSVKQMVGKRSSFLTTLVVDVLMMAWWTYFYLHTDMGTPFYMASVIWFLLWASVSIIGYRQNMRDQLLNSSLTDAASNLVKLKKQNLNMAKLSVVASIIWLGFLFNEIWGDISQNLDHAIIVFIIVFMALSIVANKMVNINRTCTDLIRQIDDLKK